LLNNTEFSARIAKMTDTVVKMYLIIAGKIRFSSVRNTIFSCEFLALNKNNDSWCSLPKKPSNQ
jgi:hypothetical protein